MTNMMVRKIVKIDSDKCDGCGVCVPSCAEGAIQVIDGKARLVADNLCDGLGNCLGECPRGAITIEDRAAQEFDEGAVEARKSQTSQTGEKPFTPPAGGCPGSMFAKMAPAGDAPGAKSAGGGASKLDNWPVQLSLVDERAAMWKDSNILLAAHCTPVAMGDFQQRLVGGRIVVIACPKLWDNKPLSDKLAGVISNNDIKSITIARMEVPCCGGLQQIVYSAMEKAGKSVPINVMVIGIDGKVQSVNGLAVGDI